MIINRLATAQRIKIVRTFAMFDASKGGYEAHNRPTNQANGKFLKNYEKADHTCYDLNNNLICDSKQGHTTAVSRNAMKRYTCITLDFH